MYCGERDAGSVMWKWDAGSVLCKRDAGSVLWGKECGECIVEKGMQGVYCGKRDAGRGMHVCVTPFCVCIRFRECGNIHIYSNHFHVLKHYTVLTVFPPK